MLVRPASPTTIWTGWAQAGRAALSVCLCVLLAAQPLPVFGAVHAGAPAMSEPDTQARVLHALNRLTFGPRPGEIAEVGRMGLERWFEGQLNPGSIDDSALEARMQQFPAMGMSARELHERFPGPAAIRQMESGRLPLPSDPTARAVALDQIEFYKLKKQQQAGKVSDPQSAGAGTAGMMGVLNQSQGDPAEKPVPAAEVNPVEPAAEADVVYLRARVQATLAELLAEPPAQRMHTVLLMPAPELVHFRRGLKPREFAKLADGLSPEQRETLEALSGSLRMVAAEETESRLLRDVYSRRELEAVMTDFWLNHFNVYLRKNQQEPYLIPAYERETIRPHALGRFEDLLVATAKSPAMLVYLDNYRSTGPDSRAVDRVKQVRATRPDGEVAKQAAAGLNENYGRELMELHTLGVNGGYTQQDVTEVAKVFTGWTLDRPNRGGGYVFQANRHEPGTKTVLGRAIREGGEKEGLEVLHLLATSPATAHFLSEKLAVRFVSDTPPPALVERMAQSFLTSGGDIRTVLRTMFHSPEFWSAEVRDAKVKTPEEFVLSAARASGSEMADGASLVKALDKLGQPVYGMQTPNGYSWTKESWVSTGALVSRLNFALVMAGDRLPGTRTGWTTLLDESAGGVRPAGFETAESRIAEKERRLEMLLLGAPVSERTRQTVLKHAGDRNMAEQAATEFDLNNTGGGKEAKKPSGRTAAMEGEDIARQQDGLENADDPQAAMIAGLLLGSPEFQRR